MIIKTKIDELEYLQTNSFPQKLQELTEKVDPSQLPMTAFFVNEMEKFLPFRVKVRQVIYLM